MIDDDELTLREFLESSNLEIAKMPPWVHSTSVSRIWKFKKSGKIFAVPCSVFRPEKLVYCFVGRPAYKQDEIDNPQEWQLPMAFVVRFENQPEIKRAFPFDSGAFSNNRLPSYITEFDLGGYEISSDERNIGRLISLVYKNPRKYFDRKAAGYEEIQDEHELTLQHQQILAVCRLALDNSNRSCDDRAATIEVSLGEDIPLTASNILGVVVPEEVIRNKSLFDWLKSITPHVETYRHLPLSLFNHYGLVYQAVEQIYKRNGVRL